jgi:putative Ig domain-containing protein
MKFRTRLGVHAAGLPIRRRIFPALAGLALAAGLAVPAALATAAPASADTVLFTATTQISNDGATAGFYPTDSSYGIWAYDGQNVSGGSDPFTRTLTVSSTSASTCTSTAGLTGFTSADNCYTASISDSGPFRTHAANDQPNQGTTNPGAATGDKISNTVAGTFTGTSNYVFYVLNTDQQPSSAYVSATVDDNDTADAILPVARNQTFQWWLQSLPVSPGTVKGVQLNNWTWTYVTTECNETWTDAYGDGNQTGGVDSYGESTPLSIFGEITGLQTGDSGCTPPTPDVVNVTNPGSQTTTTGNAVSLQIIASATDSDTVTSYSASGLPSGLSINSATGLISGTPHTTGTSTVTVTASDSDESGSVTFSWTITGTGIVGPSSSYGDEVNNFGNGFNAFQQGDHVNTEIAGWPATQGDPATHFLRTLLGDGNYTFTYAPFGTGTGLCVSNPDGGYVGDPGGPTGLVLRGCNSSIFQQFTAVIVGGKPYLKSAVNSQYVDPNGKGSPLDTAPGVVPWGGSDYSWVPFASLP